MKERKVRRRPSLRHAAHRREGMTLRGAIREPYSLAYTQVNSAPKKKIKAEEYTHAKMIMIEEAAPYIETITVEPRWRLMTHFPIIKSVPVASAPSHTSTQAIDSSGSTLNIRAKSHVITGEETATSMYVRIT